MMDFSFVNTFWFKGSALFVFLVIFTIIILKAEEKSRRKKK